MSLNLELLDCLEAELKTLDQRRDYIASWIVELKTHIFGEQIMIEQLDESKPKVSSAWDY